MLKIEKPSFTKKSCIEKKVDWESESCVLLNILEIVIFRRFYFQKFTINKKINWEKDLKVNLEKKVDLQKNHA